MSPIGQALGKALHVSVGRTYPTSEANERQTELSRQLVRLVDVLYALVLVQGAVSYRWVFTLGGYFRHSTRFVPVLLALIFIYYLTIQSFIDYHLASEDRPYQILNGKYRRLDLIRYFLDIVIVGSYSFILLKFHPLIAHSGADISAALWSLPVLFLLYLVWGELRRRTDPAGAQAYAPALLLVVWLLYGVLALIYDLNPGGSLRNASAIGAALALMLVYRWLNWPQNRMIANT